MKIDKLKSGNYYVANILKDKQNPKQLLIQGYFLGEEPQSSWEACDAIPIGGLWNKFSEGPKDTINPEGLLGKILLVHNLETWKDESGKNRFAVNWNAFELSQTKFEEELGVLFDALVNESIQDDELLANEITEDLESNEEDNNDI